ncbi:MAG: 2,3-oxidosqualene cyclase [Gemmataceae bacterium]|nr:2,3-oxidosqualene cyclase [Gemmata sp.]MDW8196467.1 2,3-oxidosqualene cyclase [Gemmataceae bacterium]
MISALGPTVSISAIDDLLARQHAKGYWEGEMVWCPVVTAQVVISRHIAGHPFSPSEKQRLWLYFQRTQTSAGSFGLHAEHSGSVFVTSLVYVAARLLGMAADHPLTARARRWLQSHGGILAAPTWGKFWLALMGLYGWEGVRPLLPELVLLPRWLPFHPLRFYCHTRYIYLAMAVLQSHRVRFNLGPITQDLIHELYGPRGLPPSFRPYRYHFASEDLIEPPGWILRLVEGILSVYDRHASRSLRQRACRRCLESILRELRTNHFRSLSPVNNTLNALIFHWQNQPEETQRCIAGFEYYRVDDDQDGLRYAGGSTTVWDTAFALEALLADPSMARRYERQLLRAYEFLAANQMTESLADRDPTWPDDASGGWCLGTAEHAWPVSDCTAEALAAVLGIHKVCEVPCPISSARLDQAVEFILSRQNADGGFGSYEQAKAPRWIERWNPSEMFTQCMTDQSYIECTGSSLVALSRYREAFPHKQSHRLQRAIDRGVRFLLQRQRSDGAFPGAWGIYLTYGTFHAVRGLRAAGVPVEHPRLQAAAQWLMTHQRTDGGWGEHFSSCLRGAYVENPQSLPSMTSWAVIALAEVVGSQHPAVRRGANWLYVHYNSARYLEIVNGVFFGSAMLRYELYPVYFPVWAMLRVGRGA